MLVDAMAAAPLGEPLPHPFVANVRRSAFELLNDLMLLTVFMTWEGLTLRHCILVLYLCLEAWLLWPLHMPVCRCKAPKLLGFRH